MATLPQTMKALVKDKPGVSYEYKDVPVPQPDKGELLIKVNKVAVCGSDIMLYQWSEGMATELYCSKCVYCTGLLSIIIIQIRT